MCSKNVSRFEILNEECRKLEFVPESWKSKWMNNWMIDWLIVKVCEFFFFSRKVPRYLVRFFFLFCSILCSSCSKSIILWFVCGGGCMCLSEFANVKAPTKSCLSPVVTWRTIHSKQSNHSLWTCEILLFSIRPSFSVLMSFLFTGGGSHVHEFVASRFCFSATNVYKSRVLPSFFDFEFFFFGGKRGI